MGWGLLGWAWCAFLPWAAWLAWRDLRHRTLDDAATLPAAGAATAIAVAAGELGPALAGMIAWAGTYAAVGVGKQGAMGGGDVKLALPLGALAGAAGGLPAVLAAMAIAGFGTAAAGAAMRARTVPHGPAMLLAAAAVTAVTG